MAHLFSTRVFRKPSSFAVICFAILFFLLWQVKRRTSNGDSAYGSHVMQYGDIGLSKDHLFAYLGTNPANDNFTFVDENFLQPPRKAVNQRDSDLVHFWDKVCVLCHSNYKKYMRHLEMDFNLIFGI